MEGLPAAFDVEADGVHHAAGSLDGGGDGALVVHVGRHLRQPGAIGRLRMPRRHAHRSEEHTSELQSLMRISYAVFCLKKKHSIPRPEETLHELHTPIRKANA